MKTAVVEKDVIGGRCLNYACIPAKAVLRVGRRARRDPRRRRLRHQGRRAEGRLRRGRRAPRRRSIKTLTGGVGGLFKKNRIDVIEGDGSLTADGNVKVGDFDGDEIDAPRPSSSPPARSKQPIPGTEFGGRVIGTEEAWALPELPARWSSSAPARRAPRSPRPTRASASRSRSSRRSTACCRPRTPTSPSSPSAASRSRASRSTPRRSSRTSQTADSSVTFTYGDEQRRGRLARHRRRPRPRRRGRSGSTRPASSSTSAA